MPITIPQVLATGALARGPQPTIEAEGGLVLRPWRDDDVPAVYAAFRDPTIQRWHARVAESEDEARGWMNEWRDAWDVEQRASWALAAADTGEVVGRTALRYLSLHEGLAEVAYWVLPAARAPVSPRAPSPRCPAGRSTRSASTASNSSTPSATWRPAGSPSSRGSPWRARSAARSCTRTAGTTATSTRACRATADRRRDAAVSGAPPPDPRAEVRASCAPASFAIHRVLTPMVYRDMFGYGYSDTGCRVRGVR